MILNLKDQILLLISVRNSSQRFWHMPVWHITPPQPPAVLPGIVCSSFVFSEQHKAVACLVSPPSNRLCTKPRDKLPFFPI